MHRVLHGDVLAHVLGAVRKDHFGNATVPGAIAETAFRSVGSGWARASRESPSELDGADVAYNAEGLIRSFTGGYLLGEEVEGTNQVALLLVRDAKTNRVECVGAQRASGGWEAVRTHNLKQLIQLLGGHNADFDTRLDLIDSVYAGLRVRPPISASSRYQSIDTYQTNSGTPLNTYATMVAFTIHGGFYKPHVVLRNDVYFSAVRATQKGINRLSVALGYHEAPKAAECKGLIVSLHNHGLPKELAPIKVKSNPEHHLRIMARAALALHEEKQALKTALVVHEGRGLRRTRKSAECSRAKMKRACRAMNCTHRSGRLRSWMQDEESHRAEASGLVDDQYAAVEDCESDADEADTDEDYSEGEEPKGRSSTKMRRYVVITSDEESSDDELDL